MKIKLTTCIPVIYFIICLVPSLALAHNLVGYVSDLSGHPIPNALVELSNGMRFSGTSNDGSYRFTVPEGTYDITASASGFSPSTASGVVVVKGVTTTQDFNLAVSPLQLEIVYPSLALLGASHAATLYGSGFVDGATRVVMTPDNGNTSKIIGSLNMEVPEAGFFTVVGNTAYVAAGEDGWKIIDISDPSSPAILSTIPEDSFAAGVAVVGNYAFLADSLAGFKVVDVSNPGAPGSPVSILPDDGSGALTPFIASITILNDRAYLADYNGALWIYDVSTPTAPFYQGMVEEDITQAIRATVVGTTAYVADVGTGGGLRIVNVSNPASPEVISTIPASDEVTDVYVENGKAFLADGSSGLRIFNVAEPLSPTELSTYNTLGSTQSVTVVDGIAYVADREKGMQAIDVSDSANPELKGYVLTEGLALDIEVIGQAAYVTDENGYFQVVDIRGMDFSTITSTNNMTTKANGIDIYKPFPQGDPIAFVAGDDGLYSFNIDDPANPVFLDSIDTPGNANDVCLIKKTVGFFTSVKAYVADGTGGLRIINVTSPGSMSEVGSYVTASDALGVDCMISKDQNTSLAFVAVGSSGLEVVDVSSTPSQFGIIDPSGSTGSASSVDFDFVNNVAYVADGTDGLRAINVTLSPPGLSHDFTVGTPGRALDVMVVGTYAYVADRKSGLQIIDLSLTTPAIISSVQTRYLSTGIYVSKNIAYATDYKQGLYAVDVSNPENPLVLGSAYTHGTAEKVEVIDDVAYVADGAMGLAVFPVVREISPVSVDSSTEMTLTIPDPLVTGNYHLKVFDTSLYDSLIGAVTFTNEIDLLSSKAIIVAGGGPGAGNLVWQNTKAYANQAYDNLIFQGYKHEDIYYLTDETDPLARYGSLASVANVEAATPANLQTAIETWAISEGANDLLIFMEDHGETEKFLMRGGTSPQYVTADELDSWLDNIQCTGPSCLPGKVILVYDACRSGSFISRLPPPSEKTRITITSSEPGQASYFLADDHSFSSHFWSTFSGKSGNKAIMTDALDRAATTMASYQAAQLDADGDGVPNQPSDYSALKGHEGTIYALRRQYHHKDRSKPVIELISDDITLSNSTNAVLWAMKVYDIDGDTITDVWAEIVAPDFNPDVAGQTVTAGTVPRISLYPPYLSVYMADYPGFTKRGTYIINYYAEDSSGIYSLPKTSLVKQNGGTLVVVPDQYEVDDTYVGSQVIVVNDPSPQNHSFHTVGDEDWVKFYGLKDAVYTLKASQPTIISDPIITVYSADGATQEASSNNSGAGVTESLIWKCPADGMYYVRLTNNSSHYGANVRYKLKVYNPIAFSIPGYVKGRITSGGKGVAGAVIRAGGGTAVTLPDGSFTLCLNPGSYSVSVSCNGYQSTSFSVNVSNGQSVSLSPRDMNSIPQILNFPPGLVKANELYNYTPVVADADGDPLTFSITGKPGWASFSTVNGRLWGRPSAANQGTHGPITITVKDNAGASNSVTFSIKVAKGTAGALPGVFLLLQK